MRSDVSGRCRDAGRVHGRKLARRSDGADHGAMAGKSILVCLLLLAACGGTAEPPSGDTSPAPSSTSIVQPDLVTTTGSATTAPPVPPATNSAAPAPLDSMRFVMSLEIVPHDGAALVPVGRLEGQSTTNPTATRLSGQYLDGTIELVSDGATWWDLDDLGTELSNEDVDLYLVAVGFLQPSELTPLLEDDGAWQLVAIEPHLGVSVEHLRRTSVLKGRDWAYGDLSQVDVWRDDAGMVVKVEALFATGDNDGFPLATWELIERNPDVEILLPAG